MIKGKIAEIFESIQGEGIYLGEKQIFVRFFGCNLDCWYCDTKLDYFIEYDSEELIQELLLYPDNYHSVSFTGGEPLLQKRFLKEVLQLCRQHGFRNYLETNGTMPEALQEVVDWIDFIAMDVKLPSSCGHTDLWHLHYKFLEIASSKETFVKVVICDNTTVEDMRRAITLIRDINIGVVLVLQPNLQEFSLKLEDKLNWFRAIAEDSGITTCIIPQVHKLVGVR